MFVRAHTTLKMSVLLLTPTESCVDPRQCASTSTSQPAAGAVTAATRTYAAAAIPAPTSSPTAPNNSPATPARSPSLANEAISKVQQLRRHQKPFVSSRIDIYRLKLELADHPVQNFVFNLITTLEEGARIGYSGPRSVRFSPNLIPAAQHPDVVSLNLQKEINLGRVAGPYPSPPLPNFQCHPVGVVPKKYSSDWRTIYHLSYPQGNSINDHIPKDPYSLSYVRVDDAINIIQSLGRGTFMANLISNQPFAWSQFTLTTGAYWAFIGNLHTTWICFYPLGSAVPRSSSTSCPKPSNGSLNTTTASSMSFTSWTTSSLLRSQNWLV